MVNAKFLTVSYSELQFDKGNMSTGKKTDSDFTKILNEQQDNFKTTSEVKNDNSSNDLKSVDESSRKEEIRNLFNKIKVDAKEEVTEEEKLEVVCAEVVQYLQNVIQKIAEELNISVEEVVQGIEDLDFGLSDLIDVKNVSKLVMNLSNQTDMSMLLVDDKFAGLIKELGIESGKMIENLKQELNLNEEQFKELVQKFEDVTKVNDFLDNNSLVPDKLEDIDNDIVVSASKDVDAKVNDANNTDEEVQVETKEVSVKVGSANEEKDFGNHSSNNNSKHNSSLNYEGISMETVVSKLQGAIESNTSISKSGVSETIMNQILDGISTNINKEMTSIELQLNPESLGKVSVTVSAKEGILTAQIAAQTEVAKEALESQISVLKETFENQGLKVEEVEVTLASKSFDQNLSNQSSDENGNSKSRKHISQEELDEINGVKAAEEEKVVEEVLKELGTTVSYRA